MLLAVDVGNTQIHLGAFDGEQLVEHWRFQTRSGATGDELAERIAGLCSLSGMSFEAIDAVCVSSVVPPLGSQFEQLAERYLDAECLTIGPGVKTGMPIRIENPLEVGEADAAEREHAGDPLGQLVAGRSGAGLKAPVLDQALAIEGAEVGLGIANVDREQHGASL